MRGNSPVTSDAVGRGPPTIRGPLACVVCRGHRAPGGDAGRVPPGAAGIPGAAWAAGACHGAVSGGEAGAGPAAGGIAMGVAGSGGNTGPGGASAAGASGRVGGGASHGPGTAGMPYGDESGAGAGGRAAGGAIGARTARWPCGGVTGALVTSSVVRRPGGSVTVTVMPWPGDVSSRTWISWRAARLPAT